jgi:hypothetical protein
MLLRCVVGTPLSSRWATNPLNSSGDRATSYMSDLNKVVCNNAKKKNKGATFRRFAVGIGHSRALERQFLPVTEGVNPPKIEFFDVVAHLEASMAQFGNMLGKRNQAIGHRWF